MAAKIITVTVLALCLIQGHQAQRLFSGPQNNLGELISDAGTLISTVQGDASAFARPQKTMPGALGFLQAYRDAIANSVGAVSYGLASAASNVDEVKETVLDSDLAQSVGHTVGEIEGAVFSDLEKTLGFILGVQANVTAMAKEVLGLVENAIHDARPTAESLSNKTVTSLISNINNFESKAKADGVDIEQCKTRELENSLVEDILKCVNDKITEASTLAKNIANVPVRASTITKDAAVGFRACSDRLGLVRRSCQLTVIPPVAVKSRLLAEDTVSYATQATSLVTTLRSQLTACAATAAGRAVSNAAEKISCVADKISSTENKTV